MLASPLLTRSRMSQLTSVPPVWMAAATCCGPAHGQLIADSVPGAELVIVPDSGHFLAAEAPESFRQEIVKFAS